MKKHSRLNKQSVTPRLQRAFTRVEKKRILKRGYFDELTPFPKSMFNCMLKLNKQGLEKLWKSENVKDFPIRLPQARLI